MTNSEKLDLLLDKVVGLEDRFTAVEGKLEVLEDRLTAVEGKLEVLEDRFTDLEGKVTDLEDTVIDLKTRMNYLSNEVNGIKMTLENETNHNIKIIAEGHCNLAQKLDEAIRISNDIAAKQEIQDIYLTMHENKLKQLCG